MKSNEIFNLGFKFLGNNFAENFDSSQFKLKKKKKNHIF